MAWQPNQQFLNFQQQNLTSPRYLDQPINPLATQYTNDLLTAKGAYDNAEKEIAFRQGLLNLGGLNDAQKQTAQAEIDILRNHQKEIANAANMTRNTAHSLGIDTTGFNADNTLAEAQQLKLNNDARAMQGLLNLKSVAEQQRDIYNQATQLGMSERDARIVAAHMNGEIRRNNENQLMNGLRFYGQNPDGSINDYGMTLLGKMTNENPYIATLFSQSFAKPKDVFDNVNENYRQQLVMDNQAKQYEQDFKNDLIKLRQIQDFTRQEREAAQKHDEQMKKLDAILKGTGVAQDKMAQEIQNLTGLTGNEQLAKELYLAQNYPNYFKINRDASGNIQLTDKEKVANLTGSRFAAIEYYLGKNDFETAQNFIDQYRNALTSDDFKYAEQLEGASVTYALNILDMYQKVAQGEITLEEMLASTNNSAANLSRVNHDESANLKAAKLGKQKAEELNRRKQEEESLNYSPPDWYTNADAFVNR